MKHRVGYRREAGSLSVRFDELLERATLPQSPQAGVSQQGPQIAQSPDNAQRPAHQLQVGNVDQAKAAIVGAHDVASVQGPKNKCPARAKAP